MAGIDFTGGGGGGGGKDDFAQGGGTNPEKSLDAIAAISQSLLG